MDKITNIKMTDEPLTSLKTIRCYENGLDYKKYATSLPYMFTYKIELITFICDGTVIDQVVDWFGKQIDIVDIGDDKYEVTVAVSIDTMEYWAMQYLNHVGIKTPILLREKIKQNLKTASEKYGR